ncbi:MAG: sigma 54-interacting transcriptional regulator [bacterium]
MGHLVTKHRRSFDKLLICLVAAGLPLVLFQGLEVLQGFEMRVISYLTYQRGERVPHDDIVLVTVDDRSVARLGWPMSRRYYADLIRAINDQGAKAIALDFFFTNLRDGDMDDSLAAATQEFSNVIHAFTLEMRGEGEMEPAWSELDTLYRQYAIHPRNGHFIKWFHADTAHFPHPRFAQAFHTAGAATLLLDADERFQKLPLIFKYNGKIYPSLSLVALCKYLGVPPDSLGFRKNFWGQHLQVNLPEERYEIPIDDRGRAYLNFYGQFERFTTYSVWELLQALEDVKAGRAPRIHLAGLKDKVVFIGGTEMGFGDNFVTPFSAIFPGVGIFATAVSNFLNGETLRELPWHINAVIVAILALMLNGVFFLANKVNKSRVMAYAYLSFAVLLLLFNLVAYQLLLKSWNIALPMLAINCAMILVFVSSAFYEEMWREKTLRQEVERLGTAIDEKLDQIAVLNATIDARDDEYKDLQYIIGDIEKLFEHPTHELSQLLQRPLDKMRIIKEKIRKELDNLHVEKQHLEIANKGLSEQINVLTLDRAVTPAPGAAEAQAEPSPSEVQRKLEEMQRVMDDYEAFAQQAKVKHHFDPAYGMVTAVVNGRLPGEAKPTRMQEIFTQISRIAPYDSTVLITGETGTGKEKLALAIRQQSRRKQGPFVVVDCGSIPEHLIESELFGHVKGGFTSAITDREGAFERAHGGTIFLDEIGELKLDLQSRLLRALQERTIQRVGGNKTVEVDVRIIAATHRNLEELVRERQFREDLYYRLDVAKIYLPPLREHKEDIPHLVHYFLAQKNQENSRQKRITDDALMAMILYDWRGNIRELENALESGYVSSLSDTIRLGDLKEDIQKGYRAVFTEQSARIWEGLVKSAQEEMGNLLSKCRELLRAENVEPALQAGQLKMGSLPYASCYECIKAFLTNKGSHFPQQQKEKLAKQIIVAMQKELYAWCKEEKLGSMEALSKEIEKLLGRGRRQVDNWERETGMAVS